MADHPPGCRCGHHVFATVVGHGLRVVPRAPFRAWRGPEGTLDIEHDAAGGTLFARLIPHEGGYRSKLAEGAYTLADVLDVAKGPAGVDWRVDTGRLSCALPAEFRLHSVQAGSSSPFYLVRPDDSMLYVQEPRSLPPLARMIGPGQRESRRGDAWIEVDYEHDAVRCWQRHELVERGPRRLVFTAQAPRAGRRTAREALAALLAGLEL